MIVTSKRFKQKTYGSKNNELKEDESIVKVKILLIFQYQDHRPSTQRLSVKRLYVKNTQTKKIPKSQTKDEEILYLWNLISYILRA